VVVDFEDAEKKPARLSLQVERSLTISRVLWSSGAVVRFLGKSGIDATTKLMGFLLICIGMEFVISGWALA